MARFTLLSRALFTETPPPSRSFRAWPLLGHKPERTSNSTGQLTVGFVQTHAYSYRLYVSPTAATGSATSATTVR